MCFAMAEILFGPVGFVKLFLKSAALSSALLHWAIYHDAIVNK